MRFLQFTLMRAFFAVVTLMTVSLIVFTLMEFVPSDCAERYLAFKNTQGSQITTADIEAERTRLGLDRPFIERWGGWMGNVFFRGDFGESCILRVSINDLLKDKDIFEEVNGRTLPMDAELHFKAQTPPFLEVKVRPGTTHSVFEVLHHGERHVLIELAR